MTQEISNHYYRQLLMYLSTRYNAANEPRYMRYAPHWGIEHILFKYDNQIDLRQIRIYAYNKFEAFAILYDYISSIKLYDSYTSLAPPCRVGNEINITKDTTEDTIDAYVLFVPDDNDDQLVILGNQNGNYVLK